MYAFNSATSYWKSAFKIDVNGSSQLGVEATSYSERRSAAEQWHERPRRAITWSNIRFGDIFGEWRHAAMFVLNKCNFSADQDTCSTLSNCRPSTGSKTENMLFWTADIPIHAICPSVSRSRLLPCVRNCMCSVEKCVTCRQCFIMSSAASNLVNWNNNPVTSHKTC